MAGCFPPPGLPWYSGVPAAGSHAHDCWEQRLTRVRPWGVEVPSTEEQARPIECLRHLCDMNQSRAEKRSTQALPVPRGGFHKAGEGPAFGGSLVTFCPIRKSPQRSVPGWGAGFHRGNRRRTSPAGCPLPRGRKQKYNNGLPWTSTAGHRIVNVSGGCKPQPYGGWARCRWNRCSHQPHPGGRRG